MLPVRKWGTEHMQRLKQVILALFETPPNSANTLSKTVLVFCFSKFMLNVSKLL